MRENIKEYESISQAVTDAVAFEISRPMKQHTYTEITTALIDIVAHSNISAILSPLMDPMVESYRAPPVGPWLNNIAIRLSMVLGQPAMVNIIDQVVAATTRSNTDNGAVDYLASKDNIKGDIINDPIYLAIIILNVYPPALVSSLLKEYGNKGT